MDYDYGLDWLPSGVVLTPCIKCKKNLLDRRFSFDKNGGNGSSTQLLFGWGQTQLTSDQHMEAHALIPRPFLLKNSAPFQMVVKRPSLYF